jgi:ring-1,2-phenylacetyl-CoA epoxidase subunit PaaD
MPDLSEAAIREALKAVKDPEIPVLSLVHMGIIRSITSENGHIRVVMTPTFAGCPAIEVMRRDVVRVCEELGATSVEVEVNHRGAWSSNEITREGREALRGFGLSPPPLIEGEVEMEHLMQAECPRCGSRNTVLRNTFGPTACRAIHHCNDCHETFEQMKPL